MKRILEKMCISGKMKRKNLFGKILMYMLNLMIWKCLSNEKIYEDINMLRLEKVNGKNIWDILKLCVFEKQKNYQVLWQNVMVR